MHQIPLHDLGGRAFLVWCKVGLTGSKNRPPKERPCLRMRVVAFTVPPLVKGGKKSARARLNRVTKSAGMKEVEQPQLCTTSARPPESRKAD